MSNLSRNARPELLVASSLRDAPHDGEALLLAERLIAAGKGKLLFDALVEEISSHAQDVVPTLMARLEKIADTSPSVAAYLMARLYPLAGRARDHEAYRGIELWMHTFSAVVVADVLRLLALEGVRRTLKSKYEEWARSIEERSKQGAP